MTSFNREQLSLLLLLRDDTLTHKIYAEASKVGRRFSPPIPYDVVQASLEHLVDAQLAETDGRDRYRISHVGSEVAHMMLQYEGEHKLRPEMVLPRSAWSYAEDEPALQQVPKQPTNWTKWGTILAGISIIVAIALAVIS